MQTYMQLSITTDVQKHAAFGEQGEVPDTCGIFISHAPPENYLEETISLTSAGALS